MTGQKLDRVLKCFRIGDPDGTHPIFDATGSTINPGRWNSAAHAILYASEHYSTALLEKLAYANGILPPNQHYVEITVPNGISYEVFDQAAHPRWAEPAASDSKDFGDRWRKDARSLLLIVPSVVARLEDNYLFNPNHPEFPKLRPSLHRPVWWDRRLFAASRAP